MNEATSLRSACLSILEVGGAFAHRFKSLLEFLGLVALVITDLDSVRLLATGEEDEEEDEDEDTIVIPNDEADQPSAKKSGKACLVYEPNAITSNQTLVQWLPRKQTISELLAATDGEKLSQAEGGNGFKVRVTYQIPTNVTWNGSASRLCGRTLEEAFGLENAEWCQSAACKHIGLKLRESPTTPSELESGLHKRVSGKSFDKTKFALGVLTQPPENWKMPFYIKEGLLWLNTVINFEVSVMLEEENESTAAAVTSGPAVTTETAE
ncbi:MAG TPA: hypothetical protein PKK23_20235 [Nitrospirales bacterium]|nr:hypothetical protein [Nitrospirales bacterium]